MPQHRVAAYLEMPADRPRHENLGPRDRFRQRVALRQAGRHRRRVSAAGTVGIDAGNPRRLEVLQLTGG